MKICYCRVNLLRIMIEAHFVGTPSTSLSGFLTFLVCLLVPWMRAWEVVCRHRIGQIKDDTFCIQLTYLRVDESTVCSGCVCECAPSTEISHTYIIRCYQLLHTVTALNRRTFIYPHAIKPSFCAKYLLWGWKQAPLHAHESIHCPHQ